ncbi:MAG: MgtC/SapB family protein [Candidatus Glassbacteria bacterium]
MSYVLTSLKLLLSLALGGLIGYEREAESKPAGLRTLALVSLGSCLFTIASIRIAGTEDGSFDPGRVASGIVTGVGFLGAGAILRSGGSVLGLTTAASIWLVAAIGMAVGMGMYGEALLATLIGYIILRKRIFSR